MDPIVASTAVHLIRAVGQGFGTDLSTVLRDGRIIAGEVLQSPGDGTLLLAIGRQQVPARTSVALDAGETFLARVREEGTTLFLELLGLSASEEPDLVRALRGVLGESRPLGELLSDLASALRAEIAATPEAERGPGGVLLAGLEEHALPSGADGETLARLLEATGLRHEAQLVASSGATAAPERRARLADDLKAKLLTALKDLPGGPAHDAVAKALSGLESEQLLNLARHRAGEPWVWSLPVPDAGGWTTARVVVPPPDEGQAGKGAEAAPVHRLTVGVSFSNTGPVRADLVLGANALSLRLSVADPRVLARLEGDAAALALALGGGQRTVHVLPRVVPRDEVLAGIDPLDIRYLREHHLMDVSG